MKLLGVVNVCGVDYSVSEASEDEEPKLENAYGFCQAYNQRIVIDGGMSAKKKIQILLHEILHALLGESGASTLLEDNLRDPEKLGKVEENLIRIIAPHLITSLESMGKLKVK